MRFRRRRCGDQERIAISSQTRKEDTVTNTDKKKWSTPKLRIFVRTRTEESVLEACKVKHQPTGPNQIDNNCSLTPPNCPNCSELKAS